MTKFVILTVVSLAGLQAHAANLTCTQAIKSFDQALTGSDINATREAVLTICQEEVSDSVRATAVAAKLVKTCKLLSEPKGTVEAANVIETCKVDAYRYALNFK